MLDKKAYKFNTRENHVELLKKLHYGRVFNIIEETSKEFTFPIFYHFSGTLQEFRDFLIKEIFLPAIKLTIITSNSHYILKLDDIHDMISAIDWYKVIKDIE